ncbi:MAG: ABC transporter permease [Lentisphaeria bacterium]|nr:ABC transporter permease [Lentisphaeria bacterium]
MRKETLQIVRDPSSILIAVVLPLLLIFIFAFAVSLDVNKLAVGIAVEDDSPEAASLVEAFTSSRYFGVRATTDRRGLIPLLAAGEIRGIIVIPGDFATRLDTPETIAPVQIITDGSEPNTANFVRNYAQGAWNVWLNQRMRDKGITSSMPVTVLDRVWYNPQLESRFFLLPGALALIMTLIGTLLTALVVAREWERGTMEALLSTSLTRSELIIGKLLPYFGLGMLSLFLSVAAMVLLFGVPLRGSFPVLAGTGAVFLFTALGLGMLISVTARNQFVACQVAFLAAFMPGMMLSGFVFEISSMPLPIRIATNFIPAKYFVSCLHSLFLVGNVWPILLPNLLFLGIVSVAFFGIIAFKVKKRID